MKKKQWLKPVLCLAVLIILLGVYFIMKTHNTKDMEKKEDADEITVTNLKTSDITGIAFEVEGEKISFSKKDIWILDGEENFPLDTSKIEAVAEGISALHAEKKIEDAENLSEYGLDKPENTIDITTKEGTTSLHIGAKNSTTSNTYVYMNDKKSVIYVVNNDIKSLLPTERMGLAVGEEFPAITAADIKEIKIEKDSDSIQLKCDSDDGIWYVTNKQGNQYKAGSASVSALESSITGLKFENMVDYKGDNMEKYGLDHPQTVIQVHYTESNKDDSKTMTLNIGAKNDNGFYFVNIEGSQEVHTMSAESLETIMNQKTESFWDMSIITLTKNQIKGLTVEYKGEKKEIEKISEDSSKKDESAREEVTYQCAGNKIDTSKFDIFFNKMTSMLAQSKDTGLNDINKPEMKIIIHTDNGDKILTYSLYDENFYLVIDMDGKPGLVSKTTIKDFFSSYEKLKL